MLWKKNKSRKESKECQGRGETISGLKVTLDPRPEAKREQAMWIFLGSRLQPKGRVGARGNSVLGKVRGEEGTAVQGAR